MIIVFPQSKNIVSILYNNVETLDKTHPEIAKQWHPIKNNSLTPSQVSAGSGKKVWWKCPNGPDHEWESIICNRTLHKTTCPCCCMRKVVSSNCLTTTHPEIAKQWHPLLNNDSPDDVTNGTNKKIWWMCAAAEDHIWRCSITDRTYKNTGCPFCANKRASSTNNMLQSFPEIAKEWYSEKNSLLPSDVTRRSTRKVWWRCKNNPRHEWESTVANRTYNKNSCPYCAGKKADYATSVLSLYPELCREWNDENFKADELLPYSHIKVWWRCQENPTHRWQSTVGNRVSLGSGCPLCVQSGGETKVKKTLERINVNFSQQYRFTKCKFKRMLPFDFAIHINNKIKLIEFHGGQHYQALDFFGGIIGYEKLLKNDNIKKSFCVDNNIPLLVISYKEINQIETLIANFLTS